MKKHAFTLVEILVTVAILAVVMTLLTLPLLSSLGYVQKAKAISEAKTASLKAIDNLKSDIEEASIIFDFPVTGEGITYLKDETEDILDTNNKVVGVKVTGQYLNRYMRILDFPWYWGGLIAPAKWTLLKPDHVDGVLPRYKDRYAPFHMSEKSGTEPRNPYIIAKYISPTQFDWSANSAEIWDYSVPLTTVDYVSLANNKKNRSILERKYRNDLQSVSPYGAMWDIPKFVVNPVRINNETLTMDKDSAGNEKPGVLFARNGLWAGRNQLLDEWVASSWSGWYTMINQDLTKLYGITSGEVSTIVGKDITTPFCFAIKDITPFYPVNTNPYGYKLKIYDTTGSLRYGTTVDNSSSPTPTYKIVLGRHFMDWPPLERDDFNTQLSKWALPTKDKIWARVHPLWNKSDIDVQRLTGKTVFSQPMSPLSITKNTKGD